MKTLKTDRRNQRPHRHRQLSRQQEGLGRVLRLRRDCSTARRRRDEGRRRQGGQDSQGAPTRQGRRFEDCKVII